MKKIQFILLFCFLTVNLYSQTREDYIGDWKNDDYNVHLEIKKSGYCVYEVHGNFKDMYERGEWSINKDNQLVVNFYSYPNLEYFTYDNGHLFWKNGWIFYKLE